MATKTNVRNEKERRQKIILAVGGVIFLVLAVIQGPKLWKQLNPESTAAPAAEMQAAVPTQPTSTGATTSTASPAPAATSASSRSAAILAGVALAPSPSPRPDDGQLRSFSRFEAKDPFVQQVAEKEPGPAADGSPRLGDTQPNADVAKPPKQQPDRAFAGDVAVPAPAGNVAVPAPAGNAAPPELTPTNATLSVNGSIQPVEVKELFPQRDKLFVLAGLTHGAAKIGVAGGSLTSGKTVKLELGKQITLVDTATGARYVVKLLYTGSQPEQIQKFTTKSK
jgi:hypothetical protein